MMEKSLKFLAGSLFALALGFVALAYGLYFVGARGIPSGIAPTPRHYPESVRLAYWHSEGGVGAPVTNRLGPVGFWLPFLFSADGPSPSADWKIRNQLTRNVLVDAGSLRASGLTRLALALRIGQHWTTDQILDSGLDSLRMDGKAFVGIEAGAQRYFGRSADQLDPAQLQVLLMIARGPASFDPWCRSERVRKALSSTSAEPDAVLASLAPKPADHVCR
jgi:Transglycosylase